MGCIKLSEEQRRAVVNTDGPELLLAVPGSGKTTTLVARLGRMIFEKHIPPRSILVITFTVAAAGDIERRFRESFGELPGASFLTINAFCQKVLWEYARIYNRKMPDLISEGDKTAEVGRLYREVYGDRPNDSDIRDLSQKITYIKNTGLKPEKIAESDSGNKKAAKLYELYQDYLRENGLMDYDDQIVFAAQVFRNPRLGRVLGEFRNRYRWIMLDEAQDTSRMQHEVIRMLAGEQKNIFMVGDEDQSIYGFRAAYPEALIHFDSFYPGGRVLKLQTNYRSGSSIVKTASRLISCNRNRVKKEMKAFRKEEGSVSFVNVKMREQQYDRIIELISEGGGQTAVLYRDNTCALPLIYKLRKAGIPFRCIGADGSFFDNRIVREALDVLRLAKDPRSKDLLWRLYYKFGAHISKKALWAATNQYDYGSDDPYLDALAGSPLLGRKARKEIKDLQAQFRAIREKDDAMDAMVRLRTSMSYRNASNEKLYILQCLAEPEEPIYDFIDRLRVMRMELEEGVSDEDADLVLSTVHGSKGLEYDRVILIDAVSGILPSTDNDIEEERRIFYVGMTRARDELMIFRYGDYLCRFPDEAMGRKPSRVIRTQAEGMDDEKLSRMMSEVIPGTFVEHRRFGKGQVVSVGGDGSAVIDFGDQGRKKLALDVCIAGGILKCL